MDEQRGYILFVSGEETGVFVCQVDCNFYMCLERKQVSYIQIGCGLGKGLMCYYCEAMTCVCVSAHARSLACSLAREREIENILLTKENVTVHSTTLPYTM